MPDPVAQFLRSVATAFVVPNLHARRSGHWRSSFARRAVDFDGNPIPWFTYPSIDYLKRQSFDGKRILEFGGGQSTLWWAARAASVTTVESDADWARELSAKVPGNTTILHMDLGIGTRAEFVALLKEKLLRDQPAGFDVIVIDSIEYRSSYAKIAPDLLTATGAIICDNSDGYNIFDALQNSGFMRVDFYGVPPGTSVPSATSIYFIGNSFLFDNSHRIGGDPA